MTDETTAAPVTPKSCPEQIKKTALVEEEFHHTRKRLARAKVAPLVQLCVFAYDCNDKGHDGANAYHIDFASMGSDVQVHGGIQASVAACEALLAALRVKLQ